MRACVHTHARVLCAVCHLRTLCCYFSLAPSFSCLLKAVLLLLFLSVIIIIYFTIIIIIIRARRHTLVYVIIEYLFV